MGDQVYTLKDSVDIPVEPAGSGLEQGWMPCTWVRYSTIPTTFSGALTTVEKSNGLGPIAGFLLYGPQHKQPVEKLSDMWQDNQREGGDTHKDWMQLDATMAMTFDKNKQLQRIGSRVVTMCIANEGVFKSYVFETKNKQERNNPGTGALLVYNSGMPIYVSENGLMTTEKETANHTYTGYGVVKHGKDTEGDYIIFCELMI